MKQSKNLLVFLSPILLLIGCAKPTNSNIVGASATQEQTYITQAKLYLDYESSSDALTVLESAIKLDKANPNLYFMQAKAYTQQKDLANAIVSYNKAIKLASKNGVYLSGYTTTVCTLDANSTLNNLNPNYATALQLEQNNPQNTAQIYADKGNCLVSRELNTEALALFESALNSPNPPIDAYTGITKAYINEGNYPKAALMINSIPNNEQNRQVILLKIDALSGLLDKKYNVKDNNRKILINKISQLQQQLAQTNLNNKNNNTVVIEEPPTNNQPKQIQNVPKTNKEPLTTVTPVIVTKPTMAKPPQSLPPKTSQSTNMVKETKSTTSFSKRIKTTNGKRYIIIDHGDTLFSVAKQSGVSQEQIIKINNLKNQFVPFGCKIYLN